MVIKIRIDISANETRNSGAEFSQICIMLALLSCLVLLACLFQHEDWDPAHCELNQWTVLLKVGHSFDKSCSTLAKCPRTARQSVWVCTSTVRSTEQASKVQVSQGQTGSGLRYQILWHIFACWASKKTHWDIDMQESHVFSMHMWFSHAIMACPGVFWLSQCEKKTCDTNHIPLALAAA